jgi:hypothetical protein
MTRSVIMVHNYSSSKTVGVSMLDSFFSFTMAACADTFLSVCRLNNGVQFHYNRVSVPFLQDKREALVDAFLCYLERVPQCSKRYDR